MEIVIALLSILTLSFLGKNFLLKRKIDQTQKESESDEIKDKLLELSARRLKIKNDVDRLSLDELVKRKRDGGNNP